MASIGDIKAEIILGTEYYQIFEVVELQESENTNKKKVWIPTTKHNITTVNKAIEIINNSIFDLENDLVEFDDIKKAIEKTK